MFFKPFYRLSNVSLLYCTIINAIKLYEYIVAEKYDILYENHLNLIEETFTVAYASSFFPYFQCMRIRWSKVVNTSSLCCYNSKGNV